MPSKLHLADSDKHVSLPHHGHNYSGKKAHSLDLQASKAISSSMTNTLAYIIITTAKGFTIQAPEVRAIIVTFLPLSCHFHMRSPSRLNKGEEFLLLKPQPTLK